MAKDDFGCILIEVTQTHHAPPIRSKLQDWTYANGIMLRLYGLFSIFLYFYYFLWTTMDAPRHGTYRRQPLSAGAQALGQQGWTIRRPDRDWLG